MKHLSLREFRQTSIVKLQLRANTPLISSQQKRGVLEAAAAFSSPTAI